MKDIKVLGPGCAKCEELMEQTKMAVAELGLDCTITKISDIQEIVSYGVMMTPALIVDGEAKVVGKVPSLDELKRLIG